MRMLLNPHRCPGFGCAWCQWHAVRESKGENRQKSVETESEMRDNSGAAATEIRASAAVFAKESNAP